MTSPAGLGRILNRSPRLATLATLRCVDQHTSELPRLRKSELKWRSCLLLYSRCLWFAALHNFTAHHLWPHWLGILAFPVHLASVKLERLLLLKAPCSCSELSQVFPSQALHVSKPTACIRPPPLVLPCFQSAGRCLNLPAPLACWSHSPPCPEASA